MGLDMYLDKIHNVELYDDIMENGVLLPEDIRDDDDFSTHTLVYWRKANQIHAFFEDTLADGCLEDCAYYEVDVSLLRQLVEACRKVKRIMDRTKKEYHCDYGGDGYSFELSDDDIEQIKDILPTREGFFFGSIEYDEYYYYDLEQTITDVCNVISEMDRDDSLRVFYHAWW